MLKTIPLLRYVVALIAGIVLADYIALELNFLIAAFSVLIIVLASGHIYLKKHVNRTIHYGLALTLFLLFSTVGMLLVETYTKTRSPLHFKSANEDYATFRVIDYPEEKDRSIALVVDALEVWDSLGVQSVVGKALLYLEKDSSSNKVNYGDVLYVRLKNVKEISHSKHVTHFNLKRYYATKNISHSGFLKASDWKYTGQNRANWLYSLAFNIRSELLVIYETYFPNKDVRGVAEAIVFGYKEDLNPQWLSAFSKTGTIHVLAVSGLHVGIIYVMLSLVLWFPIRKDWGLYLKTVLIVFILFGYSLLTGFTPSVSRACLMFSLVLVARAFQRQSNIYNTLSFAAMILLALNPFNIYNVGFQFSFLAVLGIVLYQDKIKALWPQQYWLSNKIASLVAVSIAAQIGTFALGIYYFNQYPTYFILSNILVLPLIMLVVYGGLAVIGLHFVSSFLAKLLADTVGAYITFIAASVQGIQKLPYAYVENISISETQVVVLFGILGAVTWYVFNKRKAAIAITAVLVVAFLFTDYSLRAERNLAQESLLFSDYKDAALIVRNGKNVFVLGSGSYLPGEVQYEYEVKPYLVKNRLVNRTTFYPTELTQFRSKADDILCLGDGMFLLHNKRYCWVDHISSYISKPIKVDYLIVEGNRSKAFYDAVLPHIKASATLWSEKARDRLKYLKQ